MKLPGLGGRLEEGIWNTELNYSIEHICKVGQHIFLKDDEIDVFKEGDSQRKYKN